MFGASSRMIRSTPTATLRISTSACSLPRSSMKCRRARALPVMKIFVTANARALRHFIELRGSEHADVEIRKVAVEVLKLMQHEAPNIFADYTLVTLPDGSQATHTEHVKV